MKLSLPRWILLGAVLGLLCGLTNTADAQTGKPGQVTEEQLGQVITSLGLKPTKVQQRYDFAFTAKLEEEEWQLSMSSVLSQDGEWLWVMAWLDELPKTSAEVPRTALLRLLAENDRLGNGKFFAYMPANRRFVMQVSIPNQDITPARLQETMRDLGTAVVETYPQWHVGNWTQAEGTEAAAAAAPTNGAGIPAAAATAPPAVR